MTEQRLASASETAELESLRGENQRLRAVLQAGTRINTALDVDSALDEMLNAAGDVFGADGCIVLLASAESNLRTIRRARGLSEAYLKHLHSGHIPLQRAIGDDGVLIVPDLAAEPPDRIAPAIRQLLLDQGFRAAAGVGLRHGRTLLGAMLFYFHRSPDLGPRQVQLMQAFADQASLALIHAQDFALVNQWRLEQEQSQQRLQAILDRIRDLVIVWTPEMEIAIANETARNFLHEIGADDDPARFHELLPPPANCPIHQVFRDATAVIGCEVKIGPRVFAVDCHPLVDGASGELVAVVSHAHDVTLYHRLQRELAQSEEKFRLGLELSPVGILHVEPDTGRIELTNPIVEQWSGRALEHVIGESFYSLFPPEEHPALAAAVGEVLTGGEAVCENCTLLGPGDTTTPVSLILGRLEYSTGPRRVQLVVKNIQRRLKLQGQLMEQEKLAAIGQLASGVAHELRNPIGIIASALYDLEEILESGDAEVAEDLTIAREEIARVQEIINNVLDFARSSSVEREWVDLGQLLRQTAMLLKKSMATRDVTVEVQIDGPVEVWASRGALRQVALNLLTNSFQATPDGGNVRIHSERPSSDAVRFTITDDGEGIPKEMLSRIFNPFFTTKAPGHGTGLGLSIVYSTIREHGGEIEVNSEAGQGTTFTVELPRRAPAQPPDRRQTPLSEAANDLSY